jgi:hypothetical protein
LGRGLLLFSFDCRAHTCRVAPSEYDDERIKTLVAC